MAEGDVAAGDVGAPWWSWGFVAALPVAFLGLVTPWFSAQAPADHFLTESYSAWTHPWFGMIGPWFLLWTGGQWFGVRRGWCRPPAPGDWRGASRALPFVGSSLGSGSGAGYVAMPSSRPGKPRPPAPPVSEPLLTGSWMSVAYGGAVLALLGLNRALFRPYYHIYGLGFGHEPHGSMTVHPAFGCWCVLLASGMFVATGLIGALLSVLARKQHRLRPSLSR